MTIGVVYVLSVCLGDGMGTAWCLIHIWEGFQTMAFRVINTQTFFTEEARAHLVENGCEVVDCFIPVNYMLDSSSQDEYSRAVMGADGIVAGGEHYTDKILDDIEKLKIIGRCGAGIDHVDIAGATKNGIWVTNTPGATNGAVSDLAICLMMCLLRDVPRMAQDMKEGKWKQFQGRELGAVTVGIIGTGAIGRETVKKVRGFGSEVIAYDVIEDKEFAEQWQVQYVELEELMGRADIVSLHCPFNEHTANLLDERLLRSMKKTAFLVNTSRPGVIDKIALEKVLKEKVIAGAGLDVHDPVPCGPNDSLVMLDNVIATPWAAYFSDQSAAKMSLGAAEDVVRVLNGERPRFPVNQPIRQG